MKYSNLKSKGLISSFLTSIMLLCAVTAWGAGTAIADLNFNAPTSLPSAYTYSSTNTPEIATFQSVSSINVSPSGGSTAPSTWSATDAAAPSGGKRWIAFQPAVDCRVTLKVGKENDSRTFYLMDKDHNSHSSPLSSYNPSAKNVWEESWSVSLTSGTWYAITNAGSKGYIASMQFVANPTFSETAGTELIQNSGTVTLTSSGTTIYYKWSASSSAYAADAGASLYSAADGNGSSPKPATAPNGTGTYYLYAVAKRGNYYSDVVKRNYTIVPGGACTDPTAAWSTAPANGTAGGSMNASLTTNYAAGVVYSSSDPDVATVSGNGTTTCTISYVGAGTTRITATVTGDGSTICGGPATCYTDITVAAACVAPTSVSINGTTSYTEGQTITLTASKNGGSGTASYQWYKGGTATGNKIPGAQSEIYTKASCTTADAGNYYCEVSTGSTCSTFSSACAVSVAPPVGSIVYLKPTGNWIQGNERYAVYFFPKGSGSPLWRNMAAMDDGCGGTIYKIGVPSDFGYCIFCRMNGSTTENNWDNRWDQTSNLDLANGEYCTITSSSGGSATCTWLHQPFNVCVSGSWLRFTGETITLTASCVGATNYQWYKGGTAESNKITGATNATYTKTNCTFDDAGTYYCKAWAVAGHEKISDGFDIKIPKLTIQTPPASGQSPTDRIDIPFVRANESDAYAECDQYRGVAWDYEFVVDDGFKTYDNAGKMQSDNCSNWPMDKVNSNWCQIHTTKEGTYRFYLNFDNANYTPLALSVVYPPMAQRGGVKVYIENTPAMQGRGWNNDKIYYRIGKGKYNDGDEKNWTTAQKMDLVPGTARYLYTTTPDWSDNFWVWHIANNAGWAASNNSIYKTKTGDSYAITESSNFHGDEITTDRTIILNSTSGGYGQDGMNSNCQFYGYTHTDGMILHNATVGATTNGKIKVEYTHYDNTAQSYEAKTGTTLSGLAHTCILKITGVPDCGYKIKTLTVNGVDFASGTTHILAADATIAATFEDDTYSVTFHTDGGTINSGNITSYKHGVGATLPTDVTKAGESFGGWYDNSGLTGSPIASISTTDCGDKEYWVGWSSCPALCSGTTLYKFVTKSSGLGTGNVCANKDTDYPMTTGGGNALQTLIGGTLTARANSNANRLKYATSAFTFANGDGGVLRVDLDCPIVAGDIIRYINSATNNSYKAYVRTTSGDQLTLDPNHPTVTTIDIPDEFVGESTLSIVRGGSNGALISYFEIIRPFIITLDAATNGGTVKESGTRTVSAVGGDVIGLPRAKKDGYSFKGWFDAPSGGSQVSDPYTVSGCTTLYAQFEDCPDRGTMYKFEAKTGLTNGAVTANNVAFDFNTANYLSTLVGGTLITDGEKASKVLIANTNAFSIQDNGAYLRIDMDCAIEEGDVFKSTVNGATVYVSKATSRTSTATLQIGTLTETPIPAALVGEKTLYLWKGSGSSNAISYFEITRPQRTVITLNGAGATNHYTTSVTATYGQPMPEIAVLPTRVGYVFSGYYDAPNGAGTQYYTGLGGSARNWDKTDATCTLYAYWIEPCNIAPTLTTIVPLATIWDGQKVDMSLVKLSCDFDTTGITYSLSSASENIPGCSYNYFDERIYIQGTPSLGNTTVVEKTITFTVANDCSPAHTYTVDATIRIYPANRKARLAYIITGTKNGAFTAYNSSDESNSSALLTYLRQFYTVDCVNGYATKDPEAIAEYYKDYDLLIVTDFMETPEGYTNAIGTLIDKKPILSFEAYVAGKNGSNWHINSNPADPSPKTGTMKVLCAGHAIFQDAEGVEVFNKPGGVSDTTVTVLSSCSEKGLQGFEINKAPDFIFLATVKDANNKRDLIVCCERQMVFLARLLMYCINFNEMKNLSAAGKVVMHQMIEYLLMTDETKVADCSLVFDNGAGNSEPGGGDHKWDNPANWAPGYNIIPTPYHPTRIVAECHVNVDDAHAGSVKVNKGRDEHGNLVDGKLIVKPYGGLTIAGMVATVHDTRYASPITIKAEDLLIESDETGNGALVYGNKESDVRATVEYYSLGEKANTDNPVWQYIGIPFQASQTAIKMYYAGWMCRWAEGTTDNLGGLWQWVENEDVLLPFEGYCITQEAKKTYTFQGKLNPPITTTLYLDNRDDEGYAFAANSWTAPIKIQEMADEDFENAEKSIYIYHSGTYANWTANGTPVNATTAAANLPGQYAVIPIHSSPYMAGADSVIPSMQGFFVKATNPAADASLKLVYNKVVYDSKYFKTSTQPMRAPRRAAATGGKPDVMVLTLVGEHYGDRVYLLSRGDFSEQYEDGWDGRKIEGDANAPKLAVVKEAGEMSVAAIESADERWLSFRAGADNEYTFTFDYDGEAIYLYDILTQQATRIETGNTYTFTADNQTAINRFLITMNPPKVATDVETVSDEWSGVNGVRKLLINDRVYILRGGEMFDVTGTRVELGKEGAQ